MKRILFTALALLWGAGSVLADGRERIVTVQQLPQAAQEFLKQHFDSLTVAYVAEDVKLFGSEYEVVYTDRTEVDFNKDGHWESVERKYAPVPAGIVPDEIAAFVAGNDLSEQFIRKIDRDPYTWEIELSGGLEIKFDKRFNVIGYDD